jgi:uracil-DNA glycosylase family 4
VQVDPNTRLAEALFEFWSEAGVDVMLDDVPQLRLQPIRPPSGPPLRLPTQATSVASAKPSVASAIEDATRSAAACESLEALVKAIGRFSSCPLSTMGASQAVVCRGNSNPAVVLIGEAPGQEEDRAGQPFVGPAGKLLDRILDAAGLSDKALITNTVFWHPPGNRTPTPDEQAICAPFVNRLIQLTKPKLLLCIGGASAKFMLKSDQGILAIRGRWFQWSDGSELPAIAALATLHPAFLLRQPAAKRMVWHDILTLAERLDRPERPL